MNDIVEPHIETFLSFEEQIHSPYWMAILNNGQAAYSKPWRRSWLELKSWLKENPAVKIVGLYFCFRDVTVTIHEGEADYFFVNALKAEYGETTNQKYYIGGYRDGNIVRCTKYILPELFPLETQERSLEDLSVIRGLIQNENSYTCKQTGIGSKS